MKPRTPTPFLAVALLLGTLAGLAPAATAAVDPASSTFTASAAQVPADAWTFATLTVTLRDNVGAPQALKIVALSSTRATEDIIVPPQGVSGTDGVFTAQIRSKSAGVSVISATGDGVALATTVPITFTESGLSPVCWSEAPAVIKTSCDGHYATLDLPANPLNILHIYVDRTVDGLDTTFSIGYHYSGAVPAGCTTPAAPQQYAPAHCEVAGTSTVVQARDTALDPDRDGYSTPTEILAGSNPFYRASTPANRGGGFPLDWDADGYSNKDELIGGSDMFHACSIPPAPNAVAGGVPVSLCEGPLPITPP